MTDGDGSGGPEEPDGGGGQIISPCIHVPEGKYKVAYLSYETANYFGQPKVVVHFSIIKHETHAGTPLERFYNVEKIENPPRKSGNFKVSPHCLLVRENRRLIKEPTRFDRINFLPLKGKCILARVESVTRNSRRDSLSPHEQYSKVAELLMIIDTDCL